VPRQSERRGKHNYVGRRGRERSVEEKPGPALANKKWKLKYFR